MIVMTVVMINIIPCIVVAIYYFKGKLVNPSDWMIPYTIGWSILAVVLIAYCVYDVTRPNNLPY